MARIRNELVLLIDQVLGDDPKRALAAACQLRQEIVWLEQRAVAHARANGFDWGRIGRNLGLTRQGARKKFGNLTVAAPPHVVARDRSRQQEYEFTRLWNRISEGRYGEGGDDGDEPVFW
ncbi:MAG: hypothetical protein H6513_04145 [Acidimicrobiaceae bacterium]|nr:hypothetical protein [Ilumatobacter sp.]MCB9379867.1 hypothetical protein [Acidimicrobiaceae bacterium]MCO5328899.1 hypothetical protein [Ilumatobacteraceae bacterium]